MFSSILLFLGIWFRKELVSPQLFMEFSYIVSRLYVYNERMSGQESSTKSIHVE